MHGTLSKIVSKVDDYLWRSKNNHEQEITQEEFVEFVEQLMEETKDLCIENKMLRDDLGREIYENFLKTGARGRIL